MHTQKIIRLSRFFSCLGLKIWLFILLLFMFFVKDVSSQSLSFEAVSNQDVDFVFNTIQKYQSGLVAMNAMTLRITAVGVNWDLYVGAETDVAGSWNVVTTYGTNGDEPNVELLKVRFRNTANTSQETAFFNLTDVNTPVYIIGSGAVDPSINCPGAGTNTPGSYLSEPQCYLFNIDLQITPGFSLKPGLYELIIKYVIVEDL